LPTDWQSRGSESNPICNCFDIGPRRVCATGPLDQSLCNRHETRMLIYKIFRAPEWAQMQAQGETRGAPIDLADGFVHFSTAETVQATADLYFAGVTDLVLVAVQADGLDALKWERSRGGQLFPHLFDVLRMDDVAWWRGLPLVDGAHQFGELT